MLLKIINIYKPRYFRLKLDNKSLEISQNWAQKTETLLFGTL